jgi:hypothetical protein
LKRSTLFFGIQVLIAFYLIGCKQELLHQNIPIAVWFGPQASSIAHADLVNIRQAGFNTCYLELGKSTANEQALTIADSIDLNLFISDESIDNYIAGSNSTFYKIDSLTQLYKRHKSFKGVLLYDKPGLDDFNSIVSLVDYYQSKHSTIQPAIQALPIYASPSRLDTTNYIDYLSLFSQKLKPAVLGVEHFGIVKKGLRDEFFPNLNALRKVSLSMDTPFWSYALAVPFNEHPEIVHSHLRLQLYAGLAYGAKGVQYYSLFPPQKSSYEYGDALMNDSGERTQTYWDALAINAEIAQLGPTLLGLTSTNVCFSEPKPSGCVSFTPGMPIVKIDAPTMLAGFFKDNNEDSYVLLVNTDMDYGKLANVTFSNDVKSIIEVSKNFMPPEEVYWQKDETEKEAAFLFRAGDGRLFKIVK